MHIATAAIVSGLVSLASILPPSAEAATYREIVLHSFGSGMDGAAPYASLTKVQGMVYGTTFGGGNPGCFLGCGTVFSLVRRTGAEEVRYAFCTQQNCADGQNPWGGLVVLNGTLYGTTFGGGSGFSGRGYGTVYSLDPNTGAETVLYSFCQQQNCPDGANPIGSLLYLNGVLYGTTSSGGAHGYGTTFTLDPASRVETVLYSFCQQQNCTDGQNPVFNLIAVNGVLYGITSAGGAIGCGNGLGCGTVFSLDPNTGVETVIHSFGNGHDGRMPQANLIAVNGLLYGTTYGGGVTGCGAFGCGTVFSVDPNTGTEKVLYSFCNKAGCADGANPFASLIDEDGILYGTTFSGGNTDFNSNGCGTVFSVDPHTGKETVLHVFKAGADGATPQAGLIDVRGALYGTTDAGGTYGFGTAFALRKKH